MEKLKAADAAGNLPEVMRVLGELLDENFRGYIGKVSEGFTKFLKKGVFSARYREAFWRSDLPTRFGSRWAKNKLCGDAFWRALLIEPAARLDLLSQLAKECPIQVNLGLRRQRVFENDAKWSVIRPVLMANGLGKFITDCETLLNAHKNSETNLQSFTALLEKISAETVVVHFAIWLEKVYYAFEEDRDFRISIPEKLEILQEVLARLAQATKDKAGSAKTIEELKKLMVGTCTRIRKSNGAPLETEPLFEAMDQHLAIAYKIELFCSMDWELQNDPKGISVRPVSEEQKAAWFLHQKKFHAMDTFESWCPKTPEEHALMTSCSTMAANQFSADVLWHIDTALQFLGKHCGMDVIYAAEAEMGFALKDALIVLLCNRGFFEMVFAAPRAKSKNDQGTYFDSLGLTAGPSVWRDTINGAITLVRCLPFDPRAFTVFTDNAANFEPTKHIPRERVRSIYDFFSQDIQDAPVDLSNKLLLRNQHCDLVLPRIFTGDVKSFLFNALFDNKKFTPLIADILESRIEDIFGSRNFKTLRGRELGREGEVDVLAYRDGTLFVIEAKCTHIRSKAAEVKHVRNRLNEGAAQLHRVRDLLPKYWAELHRELNAPSDLDTLQIIPLLVSNSLEFDHLYFEGILKVSDFELQMVFRNDPCAMVVLNGYHELQFGAEMDMDHASKVQERFRNLTAAEIDKIALYAPQPEPAVDELISALEESRFWVKVFGRSIELTPLGVF